MRKTGELEELPTKTTLTWLPGREEIPNLKFDNTKLDQQQKLVAARQDNKREKSNFAKEEVETSGMTGNSFQSRLQSASSGRKSPA